MAKYGTRRYASGFRYGEPSPVGVYYEANLQAVSTDYGVVQITWGNIITDPIDEAPTHWRLVKSYVGSLDDPDAGIRIAGGLFAQFTNNYTDNPGFYTTQEVHYSLWLFNGVKWILCGEDYEILVENTETLATITRWVPKAWLNPTDTLIGDGVGENENNTFYKVLGAYAFVYDKLRAQANLLNLSADPIYTPSALLRYGVTDQGHTYEPTLGDSYHRSLYGAGSLINAYKGTPLGISVYTTALTHWTNKVSTGHNLMLDYNDSSFEESIGRWTASSGTFAQKTYAAEALTPPDKTKVLYDRAFPPRLLGFGQLTTASTNTVTLSLPATGQDITIYGITVKENTDYVFSGWVKHLDGAATVRVSLSWYDMFGTILGEDNLTVPDFNTTTDWKRFTSLGTGGVRTSPRKSKFVRINIEVKPGSASSRRYAFDFFQFAEADKSLEYQDARLIAVTVNGEKENYIPNSTFQEGLYGWDWINAAAAIDDTTSTEPAIYDEPAGTSIYGVHGNKAVKLTATGSDSIFISDWVPIDTGSILTFSAYVLGTTTDSVVARIEFSNPSTEEAQTTVLTDSEGQYYPSTVYSAESEPFSLSTTEKRQVHVTAIAPPYSKDAGHPLAKVSLHFPESVASRVYYIDGAMIESEPEPSRFFSGSGGIAATDPSIQQFYSPNYTKWETKNIVNYISNPSFVNDTTTDWTSTGTLGTTTYVVSGSFKPTDETHAGVINYSTNYMTVSNTVHLPKAALGGEDFVVSVYVDGAPGTYTINGTVNTRTLADATLYRRVYGVYKLAPGATTLTWILEVQHDTSASRTMYFDGAQGEYGRIPRKFVSPADPNTTTFANPLHAGKFMYAIKTESTNSGKSNYLNNYGVKLSRLTNTLPSYIPNGSSFSVKTGHEFYGYRDLDQSLIPNASFETSLGFWQANNSTLARVISRGADYDEFVTQGQAYCEVSAAATGSFGINTSNIYISDDGSYYASVAIRPEADAVGEFELTVDFYNGADLVFTDSITKTFTSTDRWAYMANTFSIADIGGASHAVLTVMATPTAGYVAHQTFHIDRVVFRQ
jgi:hypothetical protein